MSAPHETASLTASKVAWSRSMPGNASARNLFLDGAMSTGSPSEKNVALRIMTVF